MHFFLLLIISLLITDFAIAQSNPEFERAKQHGDACYARRDWICAQHHYGIAVAIKPNDSHCKQQLKQVLAELKREQQHTLLVERTKLESKRRPVGRSKIPLRSIGNPPRQDMVWVQGGTFQMGSIEGGYDEQPVHTVTVSSFWIDKYEVTQQEWASIMENNPSRFKNCPRCPVEQVSWNDVQDFIKKLNALTGKKFRLPTEAEWEFAAREGGQNVRFGNGKSIANPAEINFDGTAKYKQLYSIDGEFRDKTLEVGSFAPNKLGIYDLSGNVFEWCADWYREYEGSRSVIDPIGPSTGVIRVLRGGSWFSLPKYCRSTNRRSATPEYLFDYIGFRLISQ